MSGNGRPKVGVGDGGTQVPHPLLRVGFGGLFGEWPYNICCDTGSGQPSLEINLPVDKFFGCPTTPCGEDGHPGGVQLRHNTVAVEGMVEAVKFRYRSEPDICDGLNHFIKQNEQRTQRRCPRGMQRCIRQKGHGKTSRLSSWKP